MAKVDEKAPAGLVLEVRDPESGEVWGTVNLQPKRFSTGSQGFYGTGKLANPKNTEARYQCSWQMILIGSKE